MHLINVTGDASEVVLTEAAAGHGWSTDTDATGCQSRLVTWDGVLVASDVDLLQHRLHTRAVKGLWAGDPSSTMW